MHSLIQFSRELVAGAGGAPYGVLVKAREMPGNAPKQSGGQIRRSRTRRVRKHPRF